MVAGVGTLMLATGARLDRTGLQNASDEVVASIGHSIGGLVSRAVSLGIPLPDLYSVDGYLDDIIMANPEVDGIAVTDLDGKVLFQRSRWADRPFHSSVAVPIQIDETAIGRIEIDASYVVARTVRMRLASAVIAASVFAGLFAAIWMRIYRLEMVDLPRARFVASSRSVGRGGFGDYSPPPDDSPLQPLGRSAARLIAPVRRQARNAAALAEEIRAIDVTHAFTSRVDAALKPLSAYRFDHLSQPLRRAGWGGWLALPAVGLIEAARPLVAGFAADRIGTDPLADVAIGLALTGDALGRFLGVLAAYVVAVHLPRTGAVFGLLIAAAGTAVTFTIHETLPFAGARIAVGFGLWLAVWSLLARAGGIRRLPWRGALLLLCAWGVGPILGGMLAEIFGRRNGFLVIGGAIGFLALVSLLQPPRPGSRATFAWRDTTAPDLAAALVAVLVLTTWLEVHLSGHLMRENYVGLTLHFGLAAAAMALPWWLSIRLPVVVGAAVALVAAWLAALSLAPATAVSVVAGLGFGLVGASLGARAYTLPTATALTAGLLIAGALDGLCYLTGSQPLSLTAAVATVLVIAAAARASWRRPSVHRTPSRRNGT
jgi:MFS family permease